jgi:FG-GAP-like repeat
MANIRIVNIIPNNRSGESNQNSEPSLAVDPLEPAQIIAGAFGEATPFFKTSNGGTTWFAYGALDTNDKSIAWKQDGSAALATTMLESGSDASISTYSGTTAGSNFGSAINTFDPDRDLDQPWIRTGPSDHVYVGYNDLSAAGGKTASVLVSTDGGSTYTPFTLDRIGGSAPDDYDQDAPSVRLAVNGSTVYSVFTRWNTVVENDSDGARLGSQVVVVRSDNGGADGFTALGAGGNGVEVAAPISVFANTSNTPLTLGQERTGSDLAIAVDPNNANHLVVAYLDAPGPDHMAALQLVVSESTNGGASWTTKFTTSSSTRSAQPALAILAHGAIGLLYDNYDPVTEKLSQHLLTTTDDFATTTDITLATESNATPISQFDPYVGDFFDLTSIGDTFYGVFSASNADNGTDALFSNVSFQREFTGTPGTASFHLTDANGNPVAFSIDPYFFSYSLLFTPWDLVASEDFTGDGIIDLMWKDPSTGSTIEWLMSPDGGVGSTPFTPSAEGWNLAATGDFNGDGISDLMWQNATTGNTSEWLMSANGGLASNPFTPGAQGWNLVANGDFNGDGTIDLMWKNASSGVTSEWLMSMNGGLAANPATPSAQGWNLVATGDFDGDGIQDLMWQNASSGVTSEWLMSASGGLASNPVTPGAQGWDVVATGDFNGDGAIDLMWQNASSGATSEWIMAKNGGLATNPATPSAEGWSLVADGDFNNDGISDLMWQNLSTGNTSEWLMSANGGLASNPFTPGAQGWNLVATGEFNGDGTTDLMWKNASSGLTSEWLMANTGGLASNPATPPAKGWTLVADGDFNGDGIDDVMWQNALTANTSEWLMSANGGLGSNPSTPVAASATGAAETAGSGQYDPSAGANHDLIQIDAGVASVAANSAFMDLGHSPTLTDMARAGHAVTDFPFV